MLAGEFGNNDVYYELIASHLGFTRSSLFVSCDRRIGTNADSDNFCSFGVVK